MESLKRCSIGEKCDTECHKEKEKRKAGFKDLDEIPIKDLEVIRLRSGLKSLDDCVHICFYHELYYLSKYAGYQLTCYDPLERHSKAVKTTLREITLEYAKTQAGSGHVLVPGKKLCFRCYNDLNEKVKANDRICIETDEAICNEEDVYDECNRDKVHSSLSSLDCSPLKQVRSDRVQSYGKRKIIEASQTIASSIAVALDVPLLEKGRHCCCEDNCENCKALIENLKCKVDGVSDRREKLQLLTLIPDSWSHDYAANFFNITKYSVRQARELKKNCGILSMPAQEKRAGLSDELRRKIIAFFEDDEISRLCPGKKDFVRVKNSNGEKVKVQKRLLLGNLKEIFL